MNPEPSIPRAFRFAAVILAAGASTRMGECKPLMKLGGASLLTHNVELFRGAGVGAVFVVAGAQADRVLAEAQRAGAVGVLNPAYPTGMLSSARAGLAAAAGADGIFVLPADVVLVRPRTVAGLMERFVPGAIFYPVFQGRRGHPPLIDGHIGRRIAAGQDRAGLDAVLNTWADRAVDVPVADRAIVLDVDTKDDFIALQARFGRRHVLSAGEALFLLETVAAVTPNIIAHGQAVAAAAAAIGRALNRCGCGLDLDVVESAAWVHDIARDRPDHARAGADVLAGLGFNQLADIVAVHMEITPAPRGIAEAEVVHLADKLVKGDRIVDLATRFGAKLQKYGSDPTAVRRICRRWDDARAIAAKVEAMTGMSLAQIVGKPE
jgi:CTP:molybdopterin cytidylyltransferase MocA